MENVGRRNDITLSRIVVGSDGVIKGSFNDNRALILSATGQAFQIVGEKGEIIQQKSQYAISQFKDLLAQVVEFRNMHLDQPYYCHAVAHLYQQFQTGYPIKSVTWSNCVEDAQQANLIETCEDGKISVKSEDSSARLVLSPHGKRFAVCFPLLLSQQGSRYNYVWQTQLFSVRDFPKRWQPALNLALTFQNTQQQNSCQRQQQQQLEQLQSSCVSYLPQLPGDFLDRDWGTGLTKEVWWQECSVQTYPKSALIQMEWTPDALYQFIPQDKEVEVWLHVDESCLYSDQDGKFFHHCNTMGGEQVFALSAIPKNVWDTTATFRYQVEPIATKALLFREAAIQYINNQVALQKENVSTVDYQSLEVDVCEEVAGKGIFQLYRDGRVHVKFSDRTILKMDVVGDKVDMILNDGTKKQTTIQNAYGVERQVKNAIDFYHSATQSYANQLQNLQGQTRVLQELEKNVVLQRQCETQDLDIVESTSMQSSHKYSTIRGSIPNFDELNSVDVEQRETVIGEWLEQNSKLLSSLDDMLA